VSLYFFVGIGNVFVAAVVDSADGRSAVELIYRVWVWHPRSGFDRYAKFDSGGVAEQAERMTGSLRAYALQSAHNLGMQCTIPLRRGARLPSTFDTDVISRSQ